MASGDTIWELDALSLFAAGSNYATQDTITDASTPPVVIPVLDFDGNADEVAYATRKVPSYYSGGGFTWEYDYAMDGTDGSDVELELRIKKISAATVLTGDLGIDTQTESAVTDTPTGTANAFDNSGTGTLSHVNAGSPAIDDWVIIGVMRDESYADNQDDLQLTKILIKET